MSKKGTRIRGFKSVLAMAMILHSGFCLLRKGSAARTVTAFSLATTLSTRSANAASSRSFSSHGARPAFYRAASTTTALSMKLQMNSTVVENSVDLQKKYGCGTSCI